MANETKQTPLTVEEIAQITAEIEGFQKLSLQHAGSNQILSAHYDRLYTASKSFLKRADRLSRTAKDKAYAAQRKNARQRSGASSSANAPTPKNS